MYESDTASLFTIYGAQSYGFCGYCKSNSSDKHIWGTNALQLSASDYQYLIDRGWRRSGRFCYKPLNDKTCCPSYTIRCDAVMFHLRKSHKRVLRNMSHFLKTGELLNKRSINTTFASFTQIREPSLCADNAPVLPAGDVAALQEREIFTEQSNSNSLLGDYSSGDAVDKIGLVKCKIPQNTDEKATEVDPIKANKIVGRINQKFTNTGKARHQRWQAKQQHIMRRSVKENVPYEKLLQDYYARRELRLNRNKPKSLENYLQIEPVKGQGKHYLDIRLLSTSSRSKQFNDTLIASHELYRSYQVNVHHDDEDECDSDQFERFLIATPILEQKHKSDAPSFGSYHQQYWLDGKQLIAVGVIDILPKCLSSVYVFYDPKFEFLHLGTYAALREIAYVRGLSQKYSRNSLNQEANYTDFKYYYMGYYIHSCPKMTYKAQYGPADLACPETFTWYPISHCILALESSPNGKYARFSDVSVSDVDAIPQSMEADELNSKILIRLRPRYGNTSNVVTLTQIKSYLNDDGVAILHEWARLVGRRVITGSIQISMYN